MRMDGSILVRIREAIIQKNRWTGITSELNIFAINQLKRFGQKRVYCNEYTISISYKNKLPIHFK